MKQKQTYMPPVYNRLSHHSHLRGEVTDASAHSLHESYWAHGAPGGGVGAGVGTGVGNGVDGVGFGVGSAVVGYDGETIGIIKK